MSQSLPVALDRLVYEGQCRRGELGEVWEYLLEVAEYNVLGVISDEQGIALCDMLGLGRADFEAAVDRARGTMN